MMDFFLITTQLSLHKMLTDGLEWCGLLWCFYQLFGLSFWRHPFTAEHPLVSKWRNATFLQIWWRNKLIYILDGLRVSSFQQIFIFGWTIPLNESMTSYHTIIHYMKLLMAANLFQYAFTTARHTFTETVTFLNVWKKKCGQADNTC